MDDTLLGAPFSRNDIDYVAEQAIDLSRDGAGNFFLRKSMTILTTVWAVATGIPVFLTTRSTSSFLFSPFCV